MDLSLLIWFSQLSLPAILFLLFFSGALMQAVEGSTVAGLVRFSKQPVQQVETFSCEDNFFLGGLLCHTPNTPTSHRVLLF